MGNMWDNLEKALQRHLPMDATRQAGGCPLDVPCAGDGPPKDPGLVATVGRHSPKTFSGLDAVAFEAATGKWSLRNHELQPGLTAG